MHPNCSFAQAQSVLIRAVVAGFCHTLLCALGALSLGAQANAGTLYGATATGAPGELYILDPSTGAMIQDIGPLNSSLGTNYPVTGLAFHPITGALYGSTAHSDANIRARLVIINPQTAQVTVVGRFNLPSQTNATMTDLAFDANGNLYGISTANGPHLCSINTATGQGTYVGPGAFNSTVGGGIAINSSGVIYSTPTTTSTTTPTTVTFGIYDSVGEFTVITNIPNPLSSSYASYGALAFDETRVLYGLNLGNGNPTPTHLFTINPTNGAATEIGASVNSLDAIAFQPTPRLGISRPANQQVTLNWPASPPGFQLEYRTNPVTGLWLTNTTSPTSSNGINFLALPAINSATYFRLHKP